MTAARRLGFKGFGKCQPRFHRRNRRRRQPDGRIDGNVRGHCKSMMCMGASPELPPIQRHFIATVCAGQRLRGWLPDSVACSGVTAAATVMISIRNNAVSGMVRARTTEQSHSSSGPGARGPVPEIEYKTWSLLLGAIRRGAMRAADQTLHAAKPASDSKGP